jgi:hypothetical protein
VSIPHVFLIGLLHLFLALMPCTHSCSVFLKEMARGDERRLKHH